MMSTMSSQISQQEANSTGSLKEKSLLHCFPKCDYSVTGIISGPSHKFQKKRLLRIVGLPESVTATSLLDFLQVEHQLRVQELQFEAPDGEVQDKAARMLFETPEEMAVAEAALNGAVFGESMIHVNPPRMDGLLFVGNLASTVSPLKLLELGKKTAPVHRAFLVADDNGVSHGYGFIEFMTRDHAIRGRADLASYVVNERPIRVDVMRPIDDEMSNYFSRTLFVDRIPKSMSESEELQRLFEQVSPVEFCEIVKSNKRSRGFAFLDFADSKLAAQARLECNDMLVLKQKIRVSFGHPQKTGQQIVQGKMEVARSKTFQSPSKPTRHRSMHNLFSAQAQAQAHAHMHARMSPYSQYPAPGAGMFYGNAPRQSYGSNSSLNTAAASAGNAPMPPPLTRQHSLPAMQMQGAGYAPFDGFGDFVPYNHMGMQGYQAPFGYAMMPQEYAGFPMYPQQYAAYGQQPQQMHAMHAEEEEEDQQMQMQMQQAHYGFAPATPSTPAMRHMMVPQAPMQTPEGLRNIPQAPWDNAPLESPGVQNMFSLMKHIVDSSPPPSTPGQYVQHRSAYSYDFTPEPRGPARRRSMPNFADVLSGPEREARDLEELGVSPLPDDEDQGSDKENSQVVQNTASPQRTSKPLAEQQACDDMTQSLGSMKLETILETSPCKQQLSTSPWPSKSLKTPQGSRRSSQEPSPSLLGGTRVSPNTILNAMSKATPITPPK